MASPDEPQPDRVIQGQNLFDEVKGFPCKVDRVEVSPPDLRTRLGLILREFKQAREAQTLDDVAAHTSEAVECLKDLGVFHRVEADIGPGLPSKPGTCTVALAITEKAWYGARVGTNVSVDGRIMVDAVGHLRNLTGNCEHYSVEYRRGGRSTQDLEEDCALKLRFPRVYGHPVHAQTAVHQTYENCQADSSYTAKMRGGAFNLISSDGKHKLGYELSWLQLSDKARRASPAVLKHLGDHIKSAVHHSYTFDGRRLSVGGIPVEGFAVRVASELSGLTPDANMLQYVRTAINCQRLVPLSTSSTFSVDLAAGVIVPLLGCWTNNQPTLIRERFTLGGVSSLRGFKAKGVGPRDQRRSADGEQQGGSDALGGDIFASVRAAVNFALPMPTLESLGIRGQVFADTGSIAQLSGRPMQQGLEEFWNQWRLSFGCGVKLPLGLNGHLELNFVQVLKSFGSDRLCPVFEVGFSAEPYTAVPPRAA